MSAEELQDAAGEETLLQTETSRYTHTGTPCLSVSSYLGLSDSMVSVITNQSLVMLVASMQCVEHSNQCCVCFCSQRWWRVCVTRADAELQQGAAVCLQTAWRGFRERQLFLRRRRAALIIQTSWRRVLQTRHSAACLIQSSWRSLRQRRRFLQQRRAAVTIQAACRGQRERHRSVNTCTNASARCF